jgi:hypothetical protein
MEQRMMPPELISALGGESKDFAVKAERGVPQEQAMGLIVFGLFWTAFVSIFWAVFFGPLLQGKEVRFTSNGVATVASLDNMGPLLMPGLIIGLFTLIGLAFLIGGFRMSKEPGPWFAGTESRLIIFSKGSVQSIDWENFTGVTHVRGTNETGEIKFELRTGRMVSRKNAPSQYVPDKVYMVGVPDPFGLEAKCRKRIKENDPTPPNAA